MKLIDFTYKTDRDELFDKLESEGVKVVAWLVKNADFEYKECSSGRYLVGKNVYQLRV